jgi:1-acyl-sn-glycerol-3-phosphate acyltransferase
MKLFKEVFGRIWALWGLITFAATLLVVLIPILLTFLIKEPLGTEVFRQITKIWMRAFLTLIGCPLKIKGKEHFRKGETYVVVCNHNSFMDVPVTTPFVPGANKTIAKKSMAKTPFFGWIYTRGSVLVDRDSDESRRQSFEEMKRTIAEGLHMVIYPEGTRNRTNEPLKRFYDGAFKLAAATNKNIVPTLLFNTKEVLPTNKPFFLWPRTLQMHFLPPVETKNIPPKEVKDHVFKIMWNYYEQHAPARKTIG